MSSGRGLKDGTVGVPSVDKQSGRKGGNKKRKVCDVGDEPH